MALVETALTRDEPINTKPLIPIFFILLAIALVIIFHVAPNLTFDDGTYIKLAGEMSNQTFSLSSPYAYGFGFIALTSVLGSLLELICFIGIILLTYYLSLRYFKPDIAFISTFCLEISAFMFLYANRILPDTVIGFIISLALYFLLTSQDATQILGKPNKRIVAAGMLMGGISFIKFGAISLSIPLILAYWLIYRRESRQLLGGFLASLILYQIALLIFFPSANIITLLQNYTNLQAHLSQASWYSNLLILPYFMLNYNVGFPEFAQIFPLGLLFIVFLGQTFFTTKKDFHFLSLFFWFAMLYMLFGSISLQHWQLITIVSRYMVYWAVPFTLIFADAIKNLDRKWLYLVVLLVILSQLPVYIYFFLNHNIVYYFVS